MLLLSILYFIMGHLSIDLSPHMHFPLILPYQTPCSCRFERRYDNYHNEAYLAIMLDIPECNRRTSRRPVPWPWSLRFEQNKGTELSWELIMTCSDMFNRPACTDVHTNTPECMDYNQEDQQHLSVMAEISFAEQKSRELTSWWPDKAEYW